MLQDHLSLLKGSEKCRIITTPKKLAVVDETMTIIMIYLNITNLEFAICKFSFVSMGVNHCKVPFNGDDKQSDHGGTATNPC